VFTHTSEVLFKRIPMTEIVVPSLFHLVKIKKAHDGTVGIFPSLLY